MRKLILSPVVQFLFFATLLPSFSLANENLNLTTFFSQLEGVWMDLQKTTSGEAFQIKIEKSGDFYIETVHELYLTSTNQPVYAKYSSAWEVLRKEGAEVGLVSHYSDDGYTSGQLNMTVRMSSDSSLIVEYGIKKITDDFKTVLGLTLVDENTLLVKSLSYMDGELISETSTLTRKN